MKEHLAFGQRTFSPTRKSLPWPPEQRFAGNRSVTPVACTIQPESWLGSVADCLGEMSPPWPPEQPFVENRSVAPAACAIQLETSHLADGRRARDARPGNHLEDEEAQVEEQVAVEAQSKSRTKKPKSRTKPKKESKLVMSAFGEAQVEDRVGDQVAVEEQVEARDEEA